MKKFFTLFVMMLTMASSNTISAQGWPENYNGVMLQGFYWDSFKDSKWTYLQEQADELAPYFSLVWIPQSANCGGQSMGYDDLYWFSNYNSSFGTESELRNLITTFKNKGIGTIADVVVNHRKNVSNWVDFPRETYNGVTYELKSTDICANDDGGATKTWATANGYSLSSKNDSGEGWDGMRDLDHYSENVQNNVKAYLKMLLNDFGYVGFRYDMVKGYAGSFTGMYNYDANPTYSVGEYWDGNANSVKSWINATKVDGAIQSAAFDFPFRYTVRDAIAGDWRKLSNASLISDNNYKRYAITFVENHDTEKRANAAQDPIRKDTLAANAFLLAMPGTPCVFYKHWIDCKQDIKAMIDVRKAAGIHSQSNAINVASSQNYYAVIVDSKLLAVVGNQANVYTPTNGNYVKVLSGYHYAYYLNKSLNTAWVDLASGEYKGEQQATLTAVSDNADAQLVYTTDGSEPTASSTKVQSGAEVTIPIGTTTLKVGLLINGSVAGVVTRQYNAVEYIPFDKYSITVYCNGEQVGWNDYINFWTWGGDGSHSPSNSNWPGDKVTTSTTIEGKKWFYKNFTINNEEDCVCFVFSTGSGSPQTVDVNDIRKDTFFEISKDQDGGKYLVNTVPMSIPDIINDDIQLADYAVYAIDGRLVSRLSPSTDIYDQLKSLPKGIYIINGKKFCIK